MTPKHTPGPWRWEYNAKHKSLSLTGGLPKYDLTVMGFERWGLHGATPSFREPDQPGLNTMDRLCDRGDWIEPFPNRKHHAHWCANVSHPDARLIAAAPDLITALDHALSYLMLTQTNIRDAAKADTRWKGVAEELQIPIDTALAAINKATGEQPT